MVENNRTYDLTLSSPLDFTFTFFQVELAIQIAKQ